MSKPHATEEPKTGHYRDSTGGDWWCVVAFEGIRCFGRSPSNFGHFTCGNTETFHRWGWKRVRPPTQEPNHE